MLPGKEKVAIPLLKVLVQLGGQGTPKEIYPLMTTLFPELSPEDRDRKLPSGGNAWSNRIQWTRLMLIQNGEMDSPSRGLWRITPKGKERLGQPTAPTSAASEEKPSLEELFDEYRDNFKKHLLSKLLDLEPEGFERFAEKLLAIYGFVETHVTSKTNDGGIDGYGRLKVGLATVSVAYQCKRWQGTVQRPEIDKFRGAIQGEYEQGIFFTTSVFSQGAKDASIKKGAVPVILLDGNSIVDLMLDKNFGVERRPLELYYEQLGSVIESDD